MNHDPVKQAWQASVEIAGAPPLDEVRAGADKFYRAMRLRNGLEYGACVVVLVVFTTYIFTLPHILQKVGSAMIIVAALNAAWQLNRRASAIPPERAGTTPIYVYLRAQLVRQRDAMRGLFWWYILPFLPGLLVSVLGNASANAGETTRIVWPGLPGALFVAGMGAVLVAVSWFNRHFAGRLQRHIDEIDALTGGTE